MGISVEAWRVVVGGFCHPKSWRSVSLHGYSPFTTWTPVNALFYRCACTFIVVSYVLVVTHASVTALQRMQVWLEDTGRIDMNMNAEGPFKVNGFQYLELADYYQQVNHATSVICEAIVTPEVVRLLQLSGDVELNPGPATRQQATISATGAIVPPTASTLKLPFTVSGG